MFKKFNQYVGVNATINTNINCTLKCSYCYERQKAACQEEDEVFWQTTSHKNEKRNYSFIINRTKKEACVLDINVAKKFIDKILDFDPDVLFKNTNISGLTDSIILDFIGGDSLQYPKLVDEILTYFVNQLISKNHKWLTSWKVSISSNGVTLLNPEARKVCEKWKDSLSLGISIDGCPELHDLNRWCFADNEDGSHKGSWQYIKEIWPWYINHFQNDALRTKWTLAPNSYKYMYDSVKFLHEKLGMIHLLYNRVMEDDLIDTPEELWECIHQFEKVTQYLIDHHFELYLSPFDYAAFAKTQSKEMLYKDDPNYARCGFGSMPTLAFDGNIYSCFRLLPGHTEVDTSPFAQGNVDDGIVSKQNVLDFLQEGSRHCSLEIPEKCEECSIYSSCPHCAAGCFLMSGCTSFKRTSSVCNFHRLQTYFCRKYWEIITRKYPKLYRHKITWTKQENDTLFELVLNEIINLKSKEN